MKRKTDFGFCHVTKFCLMVKKEYHEWQRKWWAAFGRSQPVRTVNGSLKMVRAIYFCVFINEQCNGLADFCTGPNSNCNLLWNHRKLSLQSNFRPPSGLFPVTLMIDYLVIRINSKSGRYIFHCFHDRRRTCWYFRNLHHWQNRVEMVNVGCSYLQYNRSGIIGRHILSVLIEKLVRRSPQRNWHSSGDHVPWRF